MKKKRKKKRYVVDFDMRWSFDFHVVAYTKAEARRKAFIRFIKSLRPKHFHIGVEEE